MIALTYLAFSPTFFDNRSLQHYPSQDPQNTCTVLLQISEYGVPLLQPRITRQQSPQMHQPPNPTPFPKSKSLERYQISNLT